MQLVISRLAFVFIGLIVLILSSCLLPNNRSLPPQTYLLEIGMFSPPLASRSSGKFLLVTLPRVASGFDTNRIAYTKEPLKLDYYNDSIWSDTPQKMLLPILVSAFERTGAFKAVMIPPAPSLADLRIDIDIIRLQHECMTRPSHVKVAVRTKVVDMKSGHVLGTQVFEVVETTPSEDAYGAVRAFNVAIQNLLVNILHFTLQYIG
jgi:cholesterol transport system auxiliary component